MSAFGSAADIRQDDDVRFVPILLQKSVASDECSSVDRLRSPGYDLPALRLYLILTLRTALNHKWRRPGDQRCKTSQVLGDGGENELILGASRASQSKPAELQNALQVREPHLDLLALQSIRPNLA